MKAVRCKFCPQLLLTPESRARGYGPVCGRKRGLIPPATPRHTTATTPVTAVTTPAVHPNQIAIPIQPVIPTEAPMSTSTEPPTPTRDLPQIAIHCPTCWAAPGELCTSHGGTRTRRHDVHQSRTSAWNRRTTTKEN
ncbi:zinc finger domain-containing protein [Streptomyces shenzhenensis]